MTLRAMVLATSAILAWPQMALAQDSTTDEAEPQGSVIIVTAQRQSQSLQEVPIAVSAFDATALESQQIENAADLQLTLPNVSFSKGNFTGSSFTIRGIGDLCVGVTCDAATAIHINGSPLLVPGCSKQNILTLSELRSYGGRRAPSSAATLPRVLSTL